MIKIIKTVSALVSKINAWNEEQEHKAMCDAYVDLLTKLSKEERCELEAKACAKTCTYNDIFAFKLSGQKVEHEDGIGVQPMTIAQAHN